MLSKFISDFTSAVTNVVNGVFASRIRTRSLIGFGNYGSTSNIPNIIPIFDFTVTSGKSYRVEFIGGYQSTVATTGCILKISSSVTGVVHGFFKGHITSSASATALEVPIISLNDQITTTGVSPINKSHSIYFLYKLDATSSGTIQLAFGSEVNSSSTALMANSTLIIQEL